MARFRIIPYSRRAAWAGLLWLLLLLLIVPASSTSNPSSNTVHNEQQHRRQIERQLQDQDEPIQEGCIRANSADEGSCFYDKETTCIVNLRDGREYLVELGPFIHPEFFAADDEVTCECNQIVFGSGGGSFDRFARPYCSKCAIPKGGKDGNDFLFVDSERPFQHPDFAGQGAPDCTCNPEATINHSWECNYCAFEPEGSSRKREFVAGATTFQHPIHTCLDCTCRGFDADTPHTEPVCQSDDPVDAAFVTEESPCGVTVKKAGLPTALSVFLMIVGLGTFFGLAFWRWRIWVDRVRIEEGLDILAEEEDGANAATSMKRLPSRPSVMLQYHTQRIGLGRTMVLYAVIILALVWGITAAFRALLDSGPPAPIGSGDFDAMWGNEPGLLGTFYSLRQILSKEYVFDNITISPLPEIDMMELDRPTGESWDAVMVEWRDGNSTLLESKTRNQWEATGENPLVFRFGTSEDGDIVPVGGTFVLTILYDHSSKIDYFSTCDESAFSVRFMSTSGADSSTTSSIVENGYTAESCQYKFDLDHINDGNGIGVRTRSFKPVEERARAVELSRIELFEPPNQSWEMIRVKICRRQTYDSCSYASSKRQFAAWRSKEDWKNETNPITINFAEGEAIGKAIWVTIVGTNGESGSRVVELYGREYQRDSFVQAVDQYMTPIVGGALLVVSFLLYFYLRTSYYSGPKTLFQSKEALTPIEMASLAQCLEGEARLVPGGSWMDDIVAYIRSSHEIVAFLFPLRYSPTSRHERLMVLIFELGMTYFILACFRKAGVVAPTMISKPSSDTLDALIDDGQVDNLNESLFELLAVALPVLALVTVLEFAVTYDLKKLYEMELEDKNILELPEIVDFKEKDPREKLKTGLSDLYYLSKTKAQKRADKLQTIFLGVGASLWVIGLVITATVDNEEEFIRSWFRSTTFEWAFWFAYRPFLFVVSRFRTDPFFFVEPKDDAASTQALRLAEKNYKVEPLSVDEIRAVLDEWLSSSKTCYHQGALDNLEILECYGTPSFHYSFESFAVTSGIKTMSRYKRPGDPELVEQQRIDKQNGITPQIPGEFAYEKAWTEHEVRHEIPGSLEFTSLGWRGQNARLTYQEFVCFYGTPTCEYVCEFSDLPDYLIKSASGSDVVLVESDVIPAPPLNFKASKIINLKSAEFIEKHNKDLVLDERINVLKQRHVVRLVPCWEIQFEFSDAEGANKMKNSGRAAPAVRPMGASRRGPVDENYTEDPSSTHDGDAEAVEVAWQQPPSVQGSPANEKASRAESVNKGKSLQSDPYSSKFFIYGEGDKKEVFFPAYPRRCLPLDCGST